jgi:hypothetical protein
MTGFLKLAAMLGLLCVPCFAGTVLFQGTFAEDDDVVLIPFTLTGTDLVTIESYGYAGGTLLTPSTVISEGGFAPEIFLFDSTGTNFASSTGGVVGGACVTALDSVTAECDDPYLQETLSPGSYTVALAVYDNLLVSQDLSDGFTNDGNPGFTCQGGPGVFCDLTYAGNPSRDGDYALTISADDDLVTSTTPEAASAGLCCIGGCFFAALLLRRRSFYGNRFGGYR